MKKGVKLMMPENNEECDVFDEEGFSLFVRILYDKNSSIQEIVKVSNVKELILSS